MENRFSIRFQRSGERGQQICHGSIVTESLADVGIAVHIAGSKNKTSSKLKRILAQLVLPMSGGAGAFARDLIVFPQQVKQIRMAQISGFECLALLVYQKREFDAGLFSKQPRVVHVGQPNCGKLRSFGAKG